MVLCDIRATVDARDRYLASQKEAEQELKIEKSHTQFNHVYLGSPRKPVAISALIEARHDDEAFHEFQKKVQACVRDLVSRNEDADRLATTERIARRDVNIFADERVSNAIFYV